MKTPQTRTRYMSPNTKQGRPGAPITYVGDRDIGVDELQIESKARSVWEAVTESHMAVIGKSAIRWIVYRFTRQNDRNDPLEALARRIVDLFKLGLPESSLRRFSLYLDQLIDDLCVGTATRDLDELDTLEFTQEHEENSFEHRRHIARGQVAAEQLDAEAAAIDAEITVSKEKSRKLRWQARAIRRRDLSVGASA